MAEHRIGIIGAGTMGNGIAQVCAMAGLPVHLLDIFEQALTRGLDTLGNSLQRLVRKQQLDEQDCPSILARISTSTDPGSLAGCSFIIEAASENLEVKRRILQQVAEVVSPDCVIASNTSSLSITQLAAWVSHPQRFIGVHFFNPVPLLALVEIIPALQSSEQTRERALQLARHLGKTPISVGNAPGFVVNRILIPMINEAIFVLQEGLASAEDIDTAMRLGCSHPLGPLALADLIGLDTLLAILDAFHAGFNDPKYRPATLLKEMVAAGYLGRKSGRGFHHYS